MRKPRLRARLGGIAALTLCVLVGSAQFARAAEQISEAAMKEAGEIWKSRCNTCHGPTGKGDGPAGLALTPKARDLTSPEWQKSATDENIEKIILSGGAAVGKSVLMPANPDLAAKPEVVKALRATVRNLGVK